MRSQVSDEGAATVWSLALISVVVFAGLISGAVATQVIARQRLAATADVAVLAAAQSDAAPCAAAGRMAIANGAELVECNALGQDVIIIVSAPAPDLVRRMMDLLGQPAGDLMATARAGPP